MRLISNRPLIKLRLFVLALACTIVLTAPALADAQWTIMVYMDADNNLESAGINDLNEMERVGSTDDVNVVVLLDRASGEDTSNEDWTGARLYHVTADQDEAVIGSELIEDMGEVNMGDPRTLQQFISRGIELYPASRYALILWDHGGQWIGVCSDDGNAGDSLTMSDLNRVFRSLPPKKLALVGFDACLMAGIEPVMELGSAAQVAVLSENTEPGDGWPYTEILQDLIDRPGMGQDDLGRAIVRRYNEAYPPSSTVTLSALRVPTVNNKLRFAVHQLADALIAEWMAKPTDRQKFTRARARTQMYAYPFVIDLWDFAKETSLAFFTAPQVRMACDQVRRAVDEAVILESHATGANLLPRPGNLFVDIIEATPVRDSHGVSIYYPYVASRYRSEYLETTFAMVTDWDEFLETTYGRPPVLGAMSSP